MSTTTTTRMLAIPALAIAFFGLVGCGDSDGDGLSNSQEKKYGTDANLADSDGDGVLDGDEVEQGLDPASADSDGDGYLDGDELHAGTNPTDPTSVIYAGGWPYNRDKDAIGTGGWNRDVDEGVLFPRVVGKDQFREDVELYDFANQGKPILVDISAQWCPPCRDMSDWLEGGPSTGYPQQVRRAINQGEVYWVTFIAQDNAGNDARPVTVREWDEDYPNENIPVLVDHEQRLTNWIGLRAFPTTILLNPDMTIASFDADEPYTALETLAAQLAE